MIDPADVGEIARRIVEHVEGLTGRPVSGGDDVLDREWSVLGLDSVSNFELLMRLEQDAGIALDDAFLLTRKTPRAAARAIADLKRKNR